MRKLLAANWKENPKSEREALKLFHDVARAKRGAGVEVAICPPFIYFKEIVGAFRKLKSKKHLSIGAQDVFWEEQGPYTGEVGPNMLKSLGVSYAIIGHSERRKWLNETDAMINKKTKLALRDGLRVILCVGEPLAIRKKGITAAKNFIKKQLNNDLAGISRSGKFGRAKHAMTIAYEPIWAIGTGRSDNPDDAVQIVDFIKKYLGAHGFKDANVLYGGSVTSDNVLDFVQLKDIDGALVGGASLKGREFKKIIKVVSEHT